MAEGPFSGFVDHIMCKSSEAVLTESVIYTFLITFPDLSYWFVGFFYLRLAPVSSD